MARLRAGVSFAAWERWISVLQPDSTPKTIDIKWLDDLVALELGEPIATTATPLMQALGQYLEEGEAGPDPLLLDRLQQLDEQYLGWYVRMLPKGRERLTDVQTMHARRRLFPAPGAARPSLPASTLARVVAVEQLSPERVLLLDDADAASVVLASSAQVTALVPSAAQRSWIQREAARAGMVDQIVVSDVLPPGELYDLTLLDAGNLSQTREALATALNVTRYGGHIVLIIRYPWETYLYPFVEACRLEPVKYLRDISHGLLPGGYAVDGGADLLVLQRPAEATFPQAPGDMAASIAAQPYALVEIESLCPERLDAGAIDRFVGLVQSVAPRPNAMRDCLRESGRDVLWWFDLEGYGFTAELRRVEAHLALAFTPLDPALEYVATCAALWTFGDSLTRTYPLRTRRARAGEVMA
jgi:hypothetical protein